MVASLSLGCAPDAKSGKGFSLPAGDVARGETTFTKLQCQACHAVSGVTFDKVEAPGNHAEERRRD